MKWTSFFDKIYLINLLKRTDRLLQSKWELDKYEIPYTVWEAIEKENGAEGIYLTLREIMSDALINGYKNILVFEDDALFLFNPDSVMDKVVKQIPTTYDMFHLGVNLTKGYVPRHYSVNLLHLKRGYALHACAYSRSGMSKVMALGPMLPVDWNIADNIQTQGNCYAINPMICTQRPGFSDIEKKQTNWAFALQDRFNERMNLLIPKI